MSAPRSGSLHRTDAGVPALEEPPLALYIHLPWCVSKCPYCDFNSHPLRGALPEKAYLEALLADLRAELDCSAQRPVVSVFFGGGTPSLFSAESIGALLETVAPRLQSGAEITLEANPGAVEHGRFRDLLAVGVNRLSIGVQSFDAARLHALGRIHSAAEALDAFAAAREAGFSAINVDLMYGLPEQGCAQALADLQTALALQPEHISHYQLTLEPGTVFASRPPSLPDNDSCWEMQHHCQAALAAAGYVQYEVSAFARAGHECRHNLNYWRFGDYLGVGAGAHGKYTDATAGTIRRSQRVRSPRAYMQAVPAGRHNAGSRLVPPQEAAFEYMLNVLRLREGFTLQALQARSGLKPAVLDEKLAGALRRGLLEEPSAGSFVPSERGLRFLNDLQEIFLP